MKSLKERCLQLLFPRVCPLCGKILKLPKNWHRILTEREPETSAADKDESLYRRIMICPDCYPKLNPVPAPSCAKCSRPLSASKERCCDVCKRHPRAFDSGSALWIHDDAARKVIYDLKFKNKRDHAELIGFEMALHAKEQIKLWNADVLIPIPLHKKRFLERGFNQAELIAEKLSFWLEKLYGIRLPVDPDYLLRSRKTLPQRTLDSSARPQNVQGAFTVHQTEISENQKPPYNSIILVDDIFTSGSTIASCAKTLKSSGAKRVHFLTASIV